MTENPDRPEAWSGLGTPRGPGFRTASPDMPSAAPPLRSTPPSPAATPPRPAATPSRPSAPAAVRDRPVRRTRRGHGVLTVLLCSLLGGAAGAGGVAWAVGVDDDPGSRAVAREPAAPVPGAPDSGVAAAEAILPSVVQVRTPDGAGSGFAIDRAGHLITNHHVVADVDAVRLLLPSGREIDASVVGSDPGADIAVLRADPSELTPARIGRSASLRIGQPVLAVGSPLGLTSTVTAGIVSAVDRPARIGSVSSRVVQTDASINPGNSGGPLVDLKGRVVGVNSAIATVSQGSGNIGIGFAVPVDRAVVVARQIISRR